MKYISYENGMLFTRAHEAVRQRVYEILGSHDLTISDWSILAITNDSEDGIRLAKVAKQMNVKAPLITMLANELINRDLLRRIPHHSDGRAKLLMTTAKGKKLIDQLSKEMDGAIAQLMQGISQEDTNTFRNSLQAILTNANNTLTQ